MQITALDELSKARLQLDLLEMACRGGGGDLEAISAGLQNVANAMDRLEAHLKDGSDISR